MATTNDLTLEPTTAGDPALHAFLTQHTDPRRDLLAWADAFPPLGEHSRIWLARSRRRIVGLAIAFPLWPERPALVVRAADRGTEAQILNLLVQGGALRRGYVITDPAQVPIYARLGEVRDRLTEWHYLLDAADWTPLATPGVESPPLDAIDAFYRRVGAPAWNPWQYATGPYVAIAEQGQLVAAAGTHFRVPQLAQIGNVFTDPAWRGRGLARRCTAAVTQRLVESGVPVISLFVAEENAAARRVYEGLGFRPFRPLAAFAWDAAPNSTG
ncbi:MAG TPA: GNAT family N-acetyltransferase [Oscillatoriaceae cyanobacterium]